MSINVEPIEQWLGLQSKKKDAENPAAMEKYGMDLRSRILFASLNIEYVSNVLRNLAIGRTAKDGLQKRNFDTNIDYLFKKGLMGKVAEQRFHAFRHIRNAFIHEIECKSTDDLVRLVPSVKPLMLELAETTLKAVPLPLVRTESQKLVLGLNIIANSVIAECGRMVDEQDARRRKP